MQDIDIMLLSEQNSSLMFALDRPNPCLHDGTDDWNLAICGMPKRAVPLTARAVRNERKPGMYADGHGLYLHVGTRAKSWIFRYQIDGRRRDMGLGPVDLVSLAAARDRVLDLCRGI